MKRETQFRGKVHSDNLELLESIGIKHEKGWVIGSFIAPNLIVSDLTVVNVDYFATEWWISVIPETIGQFTGLKDKNGVKIYEGDIFKFAGLMNEVRFEKGCFLAYQNDEQMGIIAEYPHMYEVVGNIFDNKELIKH